MLLHASEVFLRDATLALKEIAKENNSAINRLCIRRLGVDID